jgi:hypothetical protein
MDFENRHRGALFRNYRSSTSIRAASDSGSTKCIPSDGRLDTILTPASMIPRKDAQIFGECGMGPNGGVSKAVATDSGMAADSNKNGADDPFNTA